MLSVIDRHSGVVRRSTFIKVILCAGFLVLAGCPSLELSTLSSEVVDGNRDDSLNSTSGEPNDSFTLAIKATFDTNGAAWLWGTVASEGDIDVYDLGPLSAGDRLIVDAATADSNLDVSLVLYDEQQMLVYVNDDRGGSLDRFLDSYIEWIVRHSSIRYYLAVSHSAFSDSGQFTGSYTLDLQIVSGSNIPQPVSQILVLDFDGATINSAMLGSFTLAPFDAADISPIYDGQTESFKTTIRSVMEQNYERFNVIIQTSDDPLPPAGVEFTSIHFGGFNSSAFGIAEQVDLYNADFCDDAIIFTESFAPQNFVQTPTITQMATAIGNVAAHESGHLLGLNHVTDDLAIMDDESVNEALIEDQEFMDAPVSPQIIPIGTQNAVLLLYETVGPN